MTITLAYANAASRSIQVYNDCRGVELLQSNLVKTLADTLTAYYGVTNEGRQRKVLLSTNQLLLLLTTTCQVHPHMEDK